MRSKIKTFLPIVLILFSSCIVHAEAPIKIGVISGLSGIAGKWNRFQNMGIELAKEELAGQGVSIDIVYEDSATKAPLVISAYNKLVTLDKVDAIIANDFGFAVAPLLPIVKKEKRFLVALSLPHAVYCAQAKGYFYSATSQFSLTKDAFEHFFVLHPEVRRIALVIHDDPEWGDTYNKIWHEIANKRGVEVVDTFLSFDPTPDYKSALTKILPKKPQAIFLAHEPYSFLKAAGQLGYKGLVVSANNIFEMLVDGADAKKELEGVYMVDPMISKEFQDKFQKRFSQYPMLEAYAGYEALRSVVKAFQHNPKAPHVGIQNVVYKGVAGPIDYSNESCAGNFSRWALFRFKDGKPLKVFE